MSGEKFAVLTVCVVFLCPPVLSLLADSKTKLVWKSGLVLVPFIQGAFVQQVKAEDSASGEDEESSLKVKKGKKLLADINECLEKVKKSIETKTDVDQDTLDKVVNFKNEFENLLKEPGKLPKDMMEEFKAKFFESFRLVVQSFNVNKPVEPVEEVTAEDEKPEKTEETEKPKTSEETQKPKVNAEEAEEVAKPEEAKADMGPEVLDNKVDEKKRTNEEL